MLVLVVNIDEKLQNALEHHHVVAEICKINFVNQYVPSFQMSFHKDLAYAYKILVNKNFIDIIFWQTGIS